MTTILQPVKDIVKIVDMIELKRMGYAQDNLFDVYMTEYGNYNGFTQKAVTEYCKGLPNIADYPYMNYDIVSALEGYGIQRKTEKAKHNLIDAYWHHVGYVIFKHLEKEKKKD